MRRTKNAASLQRQTALHALRAAGVRGLPYAELRELLADVDAELVIDELRTRGHVIQRIPGQDGKPAAVLHELALLQTQGSR